MRDTAGAARQQARLVHMAVCTPCATTLLLTIGWILVELNDFSGWAVWVDFAGTVSMGGAMWCFDTGNALFG